MYSEQFMMYLAEYKQENKNEYDNQDKKTKHGFFETLLHLFALIRD